VLASGLLAALVTMVWGAVAGAGATPGRGRPGHHEVAMVGHGPESTSQLVFGIYPGGAAGSVGPGGTTTPEDPAPPRIGSRQTT
jgi:hypothetical protein